MAYTIPGKGYALRWCLPLLGIVSFIGACIGSCQEEGAYVESYRKKRANVIPEAIVSSVDEGIFRGVLGSSPTHEVEFEGYGDTTFFFPNWEEGVGEGDTIYNIKHMNRPLSGGKERAVLEVDFEK